jgi:hypothetical protein
VEGAIIIGCGSVVEDHMKPSSSSHVPHSYELGSPTERLVPLSRRNFVALLAALGTQASISRTGVAAEPARDIYVVPNFHPASCGWLTTFSRERVYCANSYITHLDRVDSDPHYAFVLSEINNITAILNFRPERFADLKENYCAHAGCP